MKNYLIVISIICIVLCQSCTLNSTQEKQLNNQLNKYMHANNKCMVVGIVGYTLPVYVQKIKEQGDSVFINQFKCDSITELSNPIFRQKQKDGDKIHVLIEFWGNSRSKKDEKPTYVALSYDNGVNWYFIEKKIYFNRTILNENQLNRLLSE